MRRSQKFLAFACLAGCLSGAGLAAAEDLDGNASTGIDWQGAAADPRGGWVMVNGIDPIGRMIAITSVATPGKDSTKFVTSYMRGESHLVVQRELNDDGTLTVTYSHQQARFTLVGKAPTGSSLAELHVGIGDDRWYRLAWPGTGVRSPECDALLAEMRSIAGTDMHDAETLPVEQVALLRAIEGYLADAGAVPVPMPRLGDEIVRALLQSALAPNGPGDTSQTANRAVPLMSCRDQCAVGCEEQCAFECLFTPFACRICKIACGIGCAIGCGG